MIFENMICNVKIIEDDGGFNVVGLGKIVIFVELFDGDEELYIIVGSVEVDLFEGKILNDLLIVKSFFGKKVDEEVIV